jgi:hypothetical protein
MAAFYSSSMITVDVLMGRAVYGDGLTFETYDRLERNTLSGRSP